MNFPIPDFLSVADSVPHRRLIRSHLPVNLLPTDLLSVDGPKIVYVARNPKDVAISAYHHAKNLYGSEASLNDHLESCLKGNTFYGSPFQHMDEYIRVAKVKNNLLLITFEDLVTNPLQVIRRVAAFLGVPLSDAEVIKLGDYISFDKMRERENSNYHELLDYCLQRNPNNKTDFRWVLRSINNLFYRIFVVAVNWFAFRFQRKGKKGSFKTEMPEDFIGRYNEEMAKWKDLMTLYPNY